MNEIFRRADKFSSRTINKFYQNGTNVTFDMMKVLARAQRGSKSSLLTLWAPLNLTKTPKSLKLFSNPLVWMFNKLDFIMLRKAWDPEFSETEFKRGVKQAVAVICTLISKNLWTNLRGLVMSKTLTRLQRDVEETWDANTTKLIAIEPSHVKMVLTSKVHFLRIAEQRLVDVDVVCVAMKFIDEEQLHNADMVLIEVLARFHRNYTLGQLPNWTVTLFRVMPQFVNSK